MKVVFDIKLDAKHLYKFNILQAYKGMQGILSIVLPILVFAYAVTSIGKVEVLYTAIYFIVGVALLLYVPLSLWKRVNMVINDPENALSKTLHYEFEEDVIRVSVEEENVEFQWENVYQMKTASDLILVYTNRINAYILPMDQVGENYNQLSELAHAKLEKYRIKMK